MIRIAIDPVACTLGPFAVSWHGVFAALAVALALLTLATEARRVSADLQRLETAALWVILAGLLGARLLHVVEHPAFYLNNPGALLALHQGGAAVLGAIVFGWLAAALYARTAKVPFWSLADLAAPAVVIGLAAGRIGSLVAGDAWGRPADLPWGVVYERADALLPPNRVGVPTHPYAAYELLWNLAIFALLWLRRGHPAPAGARFLLFVALYSVGRFGLGFFREEPIVIAGLQQAQVVALALLAVALPLLIGRYRARDAGHRRPASGHA